MSYKDNDVSLDTKIGWRQKFPDRAAPAGNLWLWDPLQIAGKRMSVGPNDRMHYSSNIFKIRARICQTCIL